MTREEAVRALKLQQESGDIEACHRMADEILCVLLRTIGYDDVVDEWEKVEKWYL